MTTTHDGGDLVAVVLSARDEIAPESDADFLRAVVAAEEAHPDDPTAAVREIEDALAVSLARGDAA
ncbi:MAG TPA: hypothetical protein VGQ83_19095 [Polyangia bacterium]|jgi:hypothetical protein